MRRGAAKEDACVRAGVTGVEMEGEEGEGMNGEEEGEGDGEGEKCWGGGGWVAERESGERCGTIDGDGRGGREWECFGRVRSGVT